MLIVRLRHTNITHFQMEKKVDDGYRQWLQKAQQMAFCGCEGITISPSPSFHIQPKRLHWEECVRMVGRVIGDGDGDRHGEMKAGDY